MNIEDDKREKATCQAFLDWYNRQHGTAYGECERAENKYPELMRDKQRRWDFICYGRRSIDWIAVEIKRLVNPKALQEVRDRLKIIKKVEAKCAGKLSGVYCLNLQPLPEGMMQSRQKELVKCLCDVVIREGLTLKDGDYVNIGPGVEQCLGWELWPGNSLPIEIYLKKIEDDSSRLFLTSFAAWTGSAIPYMSEITRLGKEADCQLTEAKTRGASKTILVFDCQFPAEKQLQNDILNVQREHQPNIDYICLMHGNCICLP